jgi:hypothetical protein
LAQWGSRVLKPSLSPIGRDFTLIGSAAQNKDLAQAQAGCRQLNEDVDGLAAKMPSPDIAVTETLSSALDNFRQFARSCQEMGAGFSENELNALTGYRDRGKSYLDKAVAMVTAAPTG